MLQPLVDTHLAEHNGCNVAWMRFDAIDHFQAQHQILTFVLCHCANPILMLFRWCFGCHCVQSSDCVLLTVPPLLVVFSFLLSLFLSLPPSLSSESDSTSLLTPPSLSCRCGSFSPMGSCSSSSLLSSRSLSTLSASALDDSESSLSDLSSPGSKLEIVVCHVVLLFLSFFYHLVILIGDAQSTSVLLCGEIDSHDRIFREHHAFAVSLLLSKHLSCCQAEQSNASLQIPRWSKSNCTHCSTTLMPCL